MDTNVRFEPSGRTGLVAAGQTVLGASRSLGVEIPLECGGLGQCDSCAVVIESGADGLSDLTEGERSYLSPERLAAGERLACQARLLGVEVTVRVPPVVEKKKPAAEKQGEPQEEPARARDPRRDQLREDFEKLPLDGKIAALAELGIEAAGDIIGEVVKTTQRIGSEVSALFSGPKSPKPPDEPPGAPDGAGGGSSN
jgi:ferredoxin